MKTIILICLALNLSASIPDTLIPYKFRTEVINSHLSKKGLKLWGGNTALSFLSGFSYGAREVVQHKPWRIPTSWNQQWWDSQLSWENKYWQNDPLLGRNNTPVMFTDAYHMAGSIHRWTQTGAGICIGMNWNNNWWNIILDGLWSFLWFQIGFTITYRSHIIFN